jgi:ubiquitin-protein ligase
MLHPPLDTVQYFPEVKNLLKKILLQRDKRDNSPESSFARKDETKAGSWRTRFIQKDTVQSKKVVFTLSVHKRELYEMPPPKIYCVRRRWDRNKDSCTDSLTV